MNKENTSKLWKIIQEAGDYLKGQLPDHPSHPKGRNPYVHVALCVKSKFDKSVYESWFSNFLTNVNQFYLVIYSDNNSAGLLEPYIKDNSRIKLVIVPFHDFYNLTRNEKDCSYLNQIGLNTNKRSLQKIYLERSPLNFDY